MSRRRGRAPESPAESSDGASSDGESGSASSASSASSAAGPSVAAQRAPRATAGRRMQTLVGDAEEQDKEFYGADIWNEDGDDSEYSQEAQAKDKFDSDFNDTEDEESEGDEEGELQRRQRRARAQAKPKPRIQAPPKKKRPPETEATRKARLQQRLQALQAGAANRTVRASTKSKTVESAHEQQKEGKRLREARKRLPVKVQAGVTQEELLLEACSTEEANNRWLQVQQRKAREREASDTVIRQQVVFRERRLSRREGGANRLVITFPMNEYFPAVFDGDADDGRSRAGRGTKRRCAITGLPAKYLDPRTRLPYATVEAFREIRRRAEATSAAGAAPSPARTNYGSNGVASMAHAPAQGGAIGPFGS